MRTTEQTVLLNAVTAYMNLLRDTAILELQRSNVKVLEATLRQTRDRFNVGEVTRTDVAQAESRLAAGRSQLLGAESNYVTSKSTYRQVDRRRGRKAPGGNPGRPVFAAHARRRHGAGQDRTPARSPPRCTTWMPQAMQVKIAEVGLVSDCHPQRHRAPRRYGSPTSLATLQTLSGAVTGQVTVPIYQGGAEYATIRQAKETLGQRRIDLDTARDQVQQTVTQAWGQLEAAKAQIEATTAQVTATEIALNGVREEARVGQRTTLDVLNAQQDLVNARVSLVTAQRDRVVASYTVLSATGAFSPQILGLPVQNYDPVTHYHQVRDSWVGVRTPDGR